MLNSIQDMNATQNNSADDSLLVKFFLHPRPDKEATEVEGRPVFKEVEHIDIKVPGSKNTGACRPATEADKQRFPRHYAAFKQRVEMPVEGTLLKEWPHATTSLVEELKFHNIKTVEQLAEVTDNAASNFMGLMGLKVKAKAWLESSKNGASTAALARELAESKVEIEALKLKVDQLLTLNIQSTSDSGSVKAGEPEVVAVAVEVDDTTEKTNEAEAEKPEVKRRRRSPDSEK